MFKVFFETLLPQVDESRVLVVHVQGELGTVATFEASLRRCNCDEGWIQSQLMPAAREVLQTS